MPLLFVRLYADDLCALAHLLAVLRSVHRLAYRSPLHLLQSDGFLSRIRRIAVSPSLSRQNRL